VGGRFSPALVEREHVLDDFLSYGSNGGAHSPRVSFAAPRRKLCSNRRSRNSHPVELAKASSEMRFERLRRLVSTGWRGAIQNTRGAYAPRRSSGYAAFWFRLCRVRSQI
jgi:hypothetical protein